MKRLDVEYEHELLSFPVSGDHDDWVDATELALSTLFKEIRRALSEDPGRRGVGRVAARKSGTAALA